MTHDGTSRWRNILPIHPDAELFPLMAEYDPAALKELADDIKVRGLVDPIVFWNGEGQSRLVDGRNRLDALEALGLLYETPDHHLGIKKWTGQQWLDKPDGSIGFATAIQTRSFSTGDPYAIALSLNVHRRHLTAEQKRERIAKVLKAKPEVSNVLIAKQVKADDKTVAKVRTELEASSEIPSLTKRTYARGRQQGASRRPSRSSSLRRCSISRPGPPARYMASASRHSMCLRSGCSYRLRRISGSSMPSG